MDKKHILVVDDEQNMRNTLEFILEAANYKVTKAGNGRKALQKILQAKNCGSPVDLIITDIMMPDMSGLELIDELNRQNINLPILVITGYGNNKLRDKLLSRGCNEYLDKPIDDEKLLKKINILLERKK